MSSKFETIEAQHGRKMRDILMDLYGKHGSITEVSKQLGVSQGTVSLWLIRVGLEVVTTSELRDKTA